MGRTEREQGCYLSIGVWKTERGQGCYLSMGVGKAGLGQVVTCQWGCGGQKWAGLLPVNRDGEGRLLTVNRGVEDRKGAGLLHVNGGGAGRLGVGCYLSMGVGKAGWGQVVTCQWGWGRQIVGGLLPVNCSCWNIFSVSYILSLISGFIKSLSLGGGGGL